MRGSWGRWKPPLGARVDPAHPLAAGLELWHIGNEGSGQRVNDIARRGSNRDGTQTPAAASPGLWADGPLGPCQVFNGTTQYVDLGSAHNMPAALQQKWTFSFWVFIAVAHGNQQIIAANGNNQAAQGYPWTIEFSPGTTNAIRYLWAPATNTTFGIWDGVAINLNQWTHVVVEDNGLGTAASVAMWYNGAKITVTNITLPSPNTKPTTNFGTTWGANPSFTGGTTGMIDNFMIWSRLLPDAQVRSLYYAPFAACVLPPWNR